jgi:hypothetical protein
MAPKTLPAVEARFHSHRPVTVTQTQKSMRKNVFFGVGLLLAADFLSASGAAAAEIIVGNSNAVAAANLPQTLINQSARWKWFFAHASVGDNIMSGIESLHAANPTNYLFTRSSVTDTPPAVTQSGVIYDYMRGNPGWQAKVDEFSNYVNNRWCYPKADVVMNKFCFIDPDADLNYYLNSMTALEAAHWRTVFVYATMPLTTNEDADNYTRNVFNDSLRDWVCANHQILYDLADIEAHDTNGDAQTFTFNDRVCQKLFAGCTDDGEHLTTEAAQQIAALEFYAVSAALLTADRDDDGMPDWWEMANGLNPLDVTDVSADPDGDGMTNLKEFLSGTAPNDPASVLKVWHVACAGGIFQMEFTGCSNITYAVQSSPSLSASSWQVLANIPADSAQRTIFVIDHLNGNGTPGFYRVAASRVSFGPP